MTETEWQRCLNPYNMLNELSPYNRRKVIFLCSACCRRVADLLNAAQRHAIESAERKADDCLPLDPYEQPDWSQSELMIRDQRATFDLQSMHAQTMVRSILDYLQSGDIGDAGGVLSGSSYLTKDVPREWEFQSNLIRCIFGNPFRWVAFAPSWVTSTVHALADQMYESRDFGTMPILADALQDAGCDSDDILDHCRGSRPHARGCWVVDLILAKG